MSIISQGLKQSLYACIFILLISGCTGSRKDVYPGSTYLDVTEFYTLDLYKQCEDFYTEWEKLASLDMRPENGVSAIRLRLGAIHHLGMTYIYGCPSIGVEPDIVKGRTLLEFANEFEYVPARFDLGRLLLRDDIYDRNLELAKEYILQGIYCDTTVGGEVRNPAKKLAKKQDWSWVKKYEGFRFLPKEYPFHLCPIVVGLYFHGPNLEYDHVARDTEHASRRAISQQRWVWVRSTASFVADVLPYAIMGYLTYEIAKLSNVYYFPPVSSTSQISSSVTPTSALLITQNQPTSSCTTDFECGFGNQCVKPAGSPYIGGVCSRMVDAYGNPAIPTSNVNIQPITLTSCRTSIDCGVGFTCVKTGGSSEGLCVK